MPNDTEVNQALLANPFFGGLSWWKPKSEAAHEFYSEALSFSAKRLRTQADFIQHLAESRDLSDVLKHHTAFVQEFWADLSKETQKVFDSGRKNLTPTT